MWLTLVRRLAELAARFFLLLVPTVIAAGLCFAIGRPFVQDVRSMQYPRTDGAVTVSEIREPSPRRPDWHLEYTYTVGERTYTGTRYEYPESGQSTRYDSEDRARLLAALPVGSKVAVAYNPADPVDSVLRPGQPGRLFERVALVLAVLGIAGMYSWAILFDWHPTPYRRPPLFDPANERHIERTRAGLLVRLPPTYVVHPLLAMLALGFLVVLVARTRPTAPDPYPWWAGFLVVVAAPAAVLTLLLLPRFPTLTVDVGRRRLLFRPGCPWRSVALAFREVQGVGLTTRAEPQKGGGRVTYYRVILFQTVRGRTRELLLSEYMSVADADALVTWLRERTGLDNRVG